MHWHDIALCFDRGLTLSLVLQLVPNYSAVGFMKGILNNIWNKEINK
jgi:hypothetical protein